MLDVNSSDKVNFHDTIANLRDFQSQIGVDESFQWVADSALYSKDRLLARWLSRVPETLSEAKQLVSLPAEALDWTDQGSGYPGAGCWLLFGAGLQRFLRGARYLRWFNISMAVLLVLSIVPIVVDLLD